VELSNLDFLNFTLEEPDSLILLFPSLACNECLVSSKRLIKYFNNKEKIRFIIPNFSIRDSNLIYSNELSEYLNLEMDSLYRYSHYVKSDPNYIWLYAYVGDCIFKIKVEGGTEEKLLEYLDKV
jgi:hypothetical protein